MLDLRRRFRRLRAQVQLISPHVFPSAVLDCGDARQLIRPVEPICTMQGSVALRRHTDAELGGAVPRLP
jgi:hypothetical protein